MLLSASRDKTLIIWNLTRDETSYGFPKRSLHGHSHIVSDCVSCVLLVPRVLRLTAYRLFRPTVHTLFHHPGTRPFVSGNSRLAPRLVGSSATLTMSFLSPSLQTTDKSFLGLGTVPSSYGILLATASIPSPRRATQNGCRAFDSVQIRKTQS
jgi:hypothetical protein